MVKEYGNPSARENLVMMTSPYERPFLRTDSEGEGGGLKVTVTVELKNAIFLTYESRQAVFLWRK